MCLTIRPEMCDHVLCESQYLSSRCRFDTTHFDFTIKQLSFSHSVVKCYAKMVNITYSIKSFKGLVLYVFRRLLEHDGHKLNAKQGQFLTFKLFITIEYLPTIQFCYNSTTPKFIVNTFYFSLKRWTFLERFQVAIT